MASVVVHLKRAFGWNLARVKPTSAEVAELAAAGVSHPVAARYAVWRRSLLLVAAAPTAVALGLAAFDTLEGGFGELTPIGIGLELAWLAAAVGLVAACLIGVAGWTRPRRSARILIAAWATTMLLPFVFALMPAAAIYHVDGFAGPMAPPKLEAKTPAKVELPEAIHKITQKIEKKIEEQIEEKLGDLVGEGDGSLDPAQLEKFVAMREMAVEFVLSGAAYLLLLPAALSLIPGAVNGCLRVKSLLPASQLPGWLLVCAAPVFLLFWAIILVVANHVARSPLLVFGVLLWAGAPIWYSICGRVFVQAQIGDDDAVQIARVKRLVLVTTLVGVGLLATFVVTTRVVGLNVVGFDRPTAVSTKIEELSADDEVSWEDVQTALAESHSLIYALDLSSWRMAVDFLAKLLVVTAVFADLVLRATLSSWRNDHDLRAGGVGAFDAAASATSELIEGTGK